MPTWSEILWPDTVEWIRLLAVILGLAAVIGLSELLRTLRHFPAEVSRKSVHILVGSGILFAPRLFISPVPILVLCLLFAVVNGLAIRIGMLKGMHGPKRESLGTVYFPISLFILTIFFWQRSPELVALAMFSFSIGDAAAAIAGESLSRPSIYNLTGDPKSVQGSIVMFVASLLSIMIGGLVVWSDVRPDVGYLIAMGSGVAAFATAWEALSSKGLDNITVPLSNALVLSVFLFPSEVVPVRQLFLGVSLGMMIAVASYGLRFLTLSGTVATALLAAMVFGFGGWKWTMPIVVFFVFSSALSFVGKQVKTDLESVFEKSSTRDHGQVAANGGIAGTIIIANYAFPQIDWYPAYCGAVAAVTADTWGTEIGILSRGRTISLLGLREVLRGSNGGVSLAGSTAGIAGAVLISTIGAQWTGFPQTGIAAAIGGVVGALMDSVIGEKYQARFRCRVCSRETERQVHCDTPTDHIGGFNRLRNDGVNWACAGTGALVAWYVARMIF